MTSSSIDTGLSIKQLGGLYINFNADKLQSNKKTLTQIKEKKKSEVSCVACPRGFHGSSQLLLETLDLGERLMFLE